MSSSRERRIVKELADINADQEKTRVYAAPHDGVSLSTLDGKFQGPPDTPYEGGIYEVFIELPDEYPFKPPEIKFKTPIWHPNISSQSGAICLDTLRTAWSPVQTIKTTLLSLRALLESPNPNDPQDAVVAREMLYEPAKFAFNAHSWAVKHAGATLSDKFTHDLSAPPPSAPPAAKELESGEFNPRLVDRFADMGLPRQTIISAFRDVGVPSHRANPSYEPDGGVIDAVVQRVFATQ
ncbi:ubiquitin-conjugating enzyme E2-24 kDa [Cordyceps fumosorosea ARSEF 2679]|uniref:Ubiquitin-conjugating enzyme E2-24 kDa n=1 Tax=Cordyceps fumosorosea (strain ARSEF 2679) TaxID=1081104 RepID=A0A167YGV6_CORFA|nr:ubiquitin-conjugating enzyme E2-24 kDa [Cordyceps fumosorosea ARSEF 2679]OAA66308.1 ubiquitin-conjugating enzyme E2-24 kDa [Cordyceps fumosorosea ARSEF 2679]